MDLRSELTARAGHAGAEAAMVLATLALVAIVACRGGETRAPMPGAAAPPSIRYDAHVFAGGVAPAAATMRNPVSGDRPSAAAGEALFTTMNCDGCHGGGATGSVGPSLVDGRWRYGGADGALFHSIYYGRPRGMPAYGGILTSEAIWKIVAYVRSQPIPKDVPTESWQ